MRSLLTCATLAIALLPSQDPTLSSRAPGNTVRWTEGAPNSVTDVKNNNKVEGIKTDDIHVFASMADVQETEYNRVWVQIANHSKASIDFDPQTVVLVNAKEKTIPAEIPEKAANSIQKFGEAKSQELSSAKCNNMIANQCQPTNAQLQMSKQVAQYSSQQAQWVRENAIAKTTLAPGQEAQGVIVFKKEHKAGNYILRCPVGTQIFEFPVSAQNKAPSYD
jgi:uncharacterized protein YaaW (UPF0174 family)